MYVPRWAHEWEGKVTSFKRWLMKRESEKVSQRNSKHRFWSQMFGEGRLQSALCCDLCWGSTLLPLGFPTWKLEPHLPECVLRSIRGNSTIPSIRRWWRFREKFINSWCHFLDSRLCPTCSRTQTGIKNTSQQCPPGCFEMNSRQKISRNNSESIQLTFKIACRVSFNIYEERKHRAPAKRSLILFFRDNSYRRKGVTSSKWRAWREENEILFTTAAVHSFHPTFTNDPWIHGKRLLYFVKDKAFIDELVSYEKGPLS